MAAVGSGGFTRALRKLDILEYWAMQNKHGATEVAVDYEERGTNIAKSTTWDHSRSTRDKSSD